jgi:hypothetical protein
MDYDTYGYWKLGESEESTSGPCWRVSGIKLLDFRFNVISSQASELTNRP